MTMSRMPWPARRRSWWAMKGSPATGSSDFGTRVVSGPRRVARPPASRARGGMASLRECALIGDEFLEGEVDCLAAVEPGLPAERAYLAGVEADYGNVSLPAALSAGVFEVGTRVEAEAVNGDFGDFGYGDGITGAHVEDGESSFDLGTGGENSVDDVGDMQVGLTLLSIAEDAETGGVAAQAADEVEADAVGLTGSHDVAEAKGAGGEAEHGAVAGDQCFAGELACSVGGYGGERAVIFGKIGAAEVSIDAAAGCVEEAWHSGAAHRLDDVVGQGGSLMEVDFGLG